MTVISAEQFQLNAILYDMQAEDMIGSITAEKATPENYPRDRYKFYCPDCVEFGHFTQLVRIKEAQRSKRYGPTPPKFDLYSRTRSTHGCQHPVRFKELDDLGRPDRYQADHLGDHSYVFPINMPGAEDPTVKGVDTARRLSNILYAVMYDPELSDKQFFRVNDDVVSLRSLFSEKVDLTQENRHFLKATLFQPIGRADIRSARINHGEILGVSPAGSGLGARLSFVEDHTLGAANKIIKRHGGNKSAPVIVFAEAVLNVEKLQEGQKPFLRFPIDDMHQIYPWEHDVSFEVAIENQAESPPLVRQRSFGFGS